MVMTLRMFKATKDSHRFRKNQKVWVRPGTPGDYWEVVFKWRGKGRYVTGRIRRSHNPQIGEVKEIDVTERFANFVATFRRDSA